MNNINRLFLLLTVQYFLSFIVSINCVTCFILAATGNSTDVSLRSGTGGLGAGATAWAACGFIALNLTLIGVGVQFTISVCSILSCVRKRGNMM